MTRRSETTGLTCKVVYYGPGLAGKTANLRRLHARLATERRDPLAEHAPRRRPEAVFESLRLPLGEVRGVRLHFHLWSVPGRLPLREVRRRLLRGVDGIVFVADSAPDRLPAAVAVAEVMCRELAALKVDVARLPIVLQYNKRDLPDALPIETLESALNLDGRDSYPAVAETGEGVVETFRALGRQIFHVLDPGNAR